VAIATSGTGPAPETVAQQTVAASPAPAAATPTPIPYDAVAELEKQLAPLEENANATTRARLIYARAALATLRRKQADHDQFIGQIAVQFKPEDLSPLLLAQSGDWLLDAGKAADAARYYGELKEYYPNSMYLDYAYVGLGEIAFGKKDYKNALNLYTTAADKIAGSKVKEATIGKAKTLLELGQYDDSRKLFEQIATVREWRGEATAYAVYSLGDIQGRQGHWAEAIAYYQRVFVLYQRYLPWVAKAYIGSAESFEKLGKRPEAIGHLQEMLRNEKLQDFPEAKQARQMLEQWGVTT
jgi:tetratricopeptide (TPR) repeat protein